ncbi:23S rRNA (guanosine(2251)-2'-O)-methyltransferase RlmB [Rhabdaerophilum sp. SD176]|uniref:23S rRNA (guanosine(2251)-2'-O)-methyltransferase RlmB n=1 Tax=Rhabdaerophilum sp. SD176 TaxID=2983548 RepID=UPI0024E03F1A|nr:23S rRNA (guanosine(2251)-2'-O)-methyltransferase RlmB [Rhabdaerophilum sp. SD176]
MKSPYRRAGQKDGGQRALPATGPDDTAPKRFKDKSRFAPKPKKEKPKPPEDCDVLYGIHSVHEALANPARKHHRLLATENGLLRLSEDLTLPIQAEVVKPDAINALLPPDAVHQGVYLETFRLPLLRLEAVPQDKIIVALDQVTDPHNVGAILRSAAAFGVGALLTTFRNSPEVSGVLAKAASGALEHVPIVGVTNLGRALTSLQEEGFLLVGLDSEATEEFHDLPLRMPLVLVLGAEGKGLRQSTRTLCNHLARLELPGAIRSLNVSNAAAISLYAVSRGLKGG